MTKLEALAKDCMVQKAILEVADDDIYSMRQMLAQRGQRWK